MPARRSTAPRTLHLLMALHDVNDVELGRLIGISRQAVHAKRTGRTAITDGDMASIAMALDIEPALLMGPPHAAVAWVVEHKPDLLDDVLAGKEPAFRCTHDLSSLLILGSPNPKLMPLFPRRQHERRELTRRCAPLRQRPCAARAARGVHATARHPRAAADNERINQ